VGRGTPAISGGAAFFPFEDFTPVKGQMLPRMPYPVDGPGFESHVRIFLIIGSNPKNKCI
jgi:hypothetical protein